MEGDCLILCIYVKNWMDWVDWPKYLYKTSSYYRFIQKAPLTPYIPFTESNNI